MKRLFYLLLAFCILATYTACKKQENDGDYPIFSMGLYFTDKATGENLIGVGKPFSPGEVSIFAMYEEDLGTKFNYQDNFSPRDHPEIGYLYTFMSDAGYRTDFIVHLGALEPDTITLKEGVNVRERDFENIEIFLNGKKQENITLQHYPNTPFIKIEKEL